MEERELSKFYRLRQEIKDLEERINEIKETGGVSGIQYKEVDVQSSSLNNSIQDKLGRLLDMLMEKRVSALEECIKIQNYINDVDDPEIRQIMRYRFIDFMKWEEIDNKMFYGTDYSRTKLRRYLKK